MTVRLAHAVVVVGGCLLLATTPGRADDLADEAELSFRIGAERYQARDYRGALEHFLASNRLVPNRNVVFNIARTYEQLGEFAVAHRYYTQAAEDETDPAARADLEAALRRVSPHVAILRVDSDPAGATIFVDRRDLGPRGTTPRTLAFPPGRYRVMAELAGHHPAEPREVVLELGRQTQVHLSLPEIVGGVRIEGAPPGTEVRVDDETAPPVCLAPCDFSLPPGRYVLYFRRDGHQPVTQVVEVTATSTTTARPRMALLTGSVVVTTDERGALVEVDGEAAGFTPAVLSVPIGARRIRVSKPGFRTVERVVEVTTREQTRIELALEDVIEVSAASRSSQAIEDAPSSVSLIDPHELRAFGFATLAESLRGVRGLYTSDDRTYASIGFRGLGRLGDYGNRVLVLLDGLPVTDNLVGSSYIGYDGRTDLEDIERIEVVRGPGSVLYGTGAFSGVVNLVPRRPRGPTRGDLTLAVDPGGVARAHAGATWQPSNDAGVWASAAVARSDGEDLFFPEYAADGGDGMARGLDGFEAATFTGRGQVGPVAAQWLLTRRRKSLPNGEYDTLFGEPGTEQTDTIATGEVRAEPALGRHLRLLLRGHATRYAFFGAFRYAPEDGGTYHETYDGAWLGAEGRLTYEPSPSFRLTAGGEGQLHPVADMTGHSDDGPYLDERHSVRVGAGYASLDAGLGARVRVSAGARLDTYSTFGNSLNPRVAVLVRPWQGGVLKVMAGTAFRAPSIYELHYNDGGLTQVPSPGLEPESVRSGEVELSHKLAPAWTALACGYVVSVEHLVVAQGDGTEENPTSYVNSGQGLLTVGGEAELRRSFRQGWSLSLSYSAQRSAYLGEGPSADRRVPNSPEHLGSVRTVVPVAGKLVVAAARLSVEGPRFDVYDRDDDPSQGRTDPFAILDVALSGELERWHLSWSAGVTNAFDWRHELPVSREFLQRTVPQRGRSFFLVVRGSLPVGRSP